ncbi:MAG: rod shape-determining protein MreD [Rhodocyclaceae bacterium]|nr:rod shape-determining protein MreD [Rhodocyclaceae bacterium]MBX3668234.1 rod shape-determining protein MreD [Rhodocyclaceae bacterium]
MQPTNTSNRILKPARPWFILFTLAAALTLNLMPIGRLPAMPDWVALVLAFWCVREPLRVGMMSGFALGLLTDVGIGSLFGQHALAYVLVAYFAASLSRRILWFPFLQQALHIFPVLFSAQLLMLLARLVAGGEFPGWTWFLESVTAALLWYPLNLALLLPQFRPVEKDENRPI